MVKKVVLGTTPISIWTNSFLKKQASGFTLIEILVVLAILAAVISLGVPRLINKENNLKSVVRGFLVLSKEIRNKAKISNSTYRLVIDFGEDPQSAQSYWVESAPGPRPIDTDAEKNLEAPPKTSSDFQLDARLNKKPKVLPKGLFFSELETINSKNTITSGKGYIHFFPEGFIEAATLQITDRKKNTWTLVFNPLTGQADVIPEAQSLKGLQR